VLQCFSRQAPFSKSGLAGATGIDIQWTWLAVLYRLWNVAAGLECLQRRPDEPWCMYGV
jgi:hypothetical protein